MAINTTTGTCSDVMVRRLIGTKGKKGGLAAYIRRGEKYAMPKMSPMMKGKR